MLKSANISTPVFQNQFSKLTKLLLCNKLYCRKFADILHIQLTKNGTKIPNCDHTESHNSACQACKIKVKKAEIAKRVAEAEKARKLARERKAESRRKFWRDVDMEFEFLRSFDIVDTSAREKAEKERSKINKFMRDTERLYRGPQLSSEEDIEEKRKRQAGLRKKFNRADARWSLVREEAELKYFTWANVVLESRIKAKQEDLDFQLADLDVACLELQDKITEKENILESLRKLRKSGNGN